MTLVIKGQEITANSLSGRRRVLGPAPNLHRTPCKTQSSKVSYVHEKMPKKKETGEFVR